MPPFMIYSLFFVLFLLKVGGCMVFLYWTFFQGLWLNMILIQKVVCFLSPSFGELIANTQLWEFVITNLNEFYFCFFYCQLCYRLYKSKNEVKLCKQPTPLHIVYYNIKMKFKVLHLH